MIELQSNNVKLNVGKRIQFFNIELRAFQVIWKSKTPSKEKFAINFIEPMANQVDVSFISREFDSLNKLKESIVLECQYFDMNQDFLIEFLKIQNEIAKSLESEVLFNELLINLGIISREIWVEFRYKIHKIEDFVDVWTTKTKEMSNQHDAKIILEKLETVSNTIPSLKLLRGDNWTNTHWAHFFHILGIKDTQLSELTLGHLLSNCKIITEKISEIKQLNERVVGEMYIRETLQKLELYSETAIFKFSAFTNNQNLQIQIIVGWKELLQEISELQSLLQNTKDSQFYSNFKDQVGLWDTKLQDLDKILFDFNIAQQKFLYLEPIFKSKTLPKNTMIYFQHRDWILNFYKIVFKKKKVIQVLSNVNLKQELFKLVEGLELVEMVLKSYLDEKRVIFSQFYFLSDKDCLELLGNPLSITHIQKHVRNIFISTKELQFSTDELFVTGIESDEGEIITLNEPVHMILDIELWLSELKTQIHSTLRNLYLNNVDKEPLTLAVPSQIISLILSIRFTARCEYAINSKTLSSYLTSENESLSLFIYKFRSEPHSNLETKRYVSKVQDWIKNIDILDELSKMKSLDSINDWRWLQKLRVYNINKEAVIKIGYSDFKYSFDYQGIKEKLVYTKLTEKCFGILAYSLSRGLGGNPYGPAGY